MRFPEDKIKEAILHPDLEIRDRATDYFAKSYSHDVSIMAQVIKAVETYGRQDAYRLIGPSRDLPQTVESIAWVIDELNDDQSDTYENYTYNLSMVLVEADPALLLPKESSILEARHFLPDLRSAFTERLSMSRGTRRPVGGSWKSSARRERASSTPTKLTWAMPSESWKPWLVTGRDARGRSTPSSARRWRTTAKTR